jgi:hypothetical protein
MAGRCGEGFVGVEIQETAKEASQQGRMGLHN